MRVPVSQVNTRIAVSQDVRHTGQRSVPVWPRLVARAALARSISVHALQRHRWPHGISACVRSWSQHTTHDVSELSGEAAGC